MEKINDPKQLKAYYRQYQMEKLFSQNLIKSFELIKINRMEYICDQEGKVEYLYFLVEGKAKVCKALGNGKTMLLRFYNPFSVIGDLEWIRGTSFSCTVQALTECYLLALPIKEMKAILQNDIKLLKFICEALAEKLDHISNNSSINLLYPLENRLASYVNQTAEKIQDDMLEGKRCFNENLTQLAELLGTSYRHLLRTINGMCEKEILERAESGYLILKEDQLDKMSGELYK